MSSNSLHRSISQSCIAMVSGLIISLSVSLVSMPMVKAETNSLTQMFPVLVGVSLTSIQQQQLKELVNQSIPKLKINLSSEQKTKFDQALADGKGLRNTILSLDLPLSQKLKLRQSMQTTRSQINQILTPQQQQQVMQNASSLQSK